MLHGQKNIKSLILSCDNVANEGYVCVRVCV